MDRDVPRVDVNANIHNWVSTEVLPNFRRAALVRDDQAIVGLVSLSDTRKIPEEAWSSHTISEIMTPMQKLKWVYIDDFTDSVLKIMQQAGVNQVPVVEGKTVVGWVDREKLVHALNVYAEAGEINRG